jgi:hypothetical protein
MLYLGKTVLLINFEKRHIQSQIVNHEITGFTIITYILLDSFAAGTTLYR